MDDETRLQVVDRLLKRTQASMVDSLAATIDVERELFELYREDENASDLAETHTPAHKQ